MAQGASVTGVSLVRICALATGCAVVVCLGSESFGAAKPPPEISRDDKEGSHGRTDGAAVDGTDSPQATPQEDLELLEWMRKMLEASRETGGEALEDTSRVLREIARRIGQQSMDTATHVAEWVRHDWNNIWAWKYRVVAAGDMASPVVEQKLNQLGQEGWECFHVGLGTDGTPVFYFKKPERSYLKSIPLRDLLKTLSITEGVD